MTILLPRAVALTTGLGVALLAATAAALDAWMTEDAMRASFIGKTLDGRESARRAVGTWHFRGHVFCTFYDPSPAQSPLNGGCWTAIKTGANCYEFYLAGITPEPPFADDAPGMAQRWNARGWRKDEPSTCHDKPSV
jgi:hypothetical protein